MAKSTPQPRRPRKDQPRTKKINHEAARQADHIEVRVNGAQVEVSPILETAIRRAVGAAARPLPKEMTTTQAADFLDVSRPFIIKLIKQGKLPCRMVGKHRRIPSDALVAYREVLFQKARKAADEMVRISQELGLYDDPPCLAPQPVTPHRCCTVRAT